MASHNIPVDTCMLIKNTMLDFILIAFVLSTFFALSVILGHGQCYHFENSEDSLILVEGSLGSKWQWDSSGIGHDSNGSMKSSDFTNRSVRLLSDSTSKDIEGPADISFWWKLSARPSGCAEIQFLIDNRLKCYLDYVTDWERKSYSIDEGIHNIEWRFIVTDSQQIEHAFGQIDDLCICGPNGAVVDIPSIEAIAPDFSIEQNSELNDQVFVNNGVTCSEGCKLELDYSEVDISNPGTYVYTVNCRNDLNSVRSDGTVKVVPSIEAIAPNFSIEQNSELNDQVFVNNGVTCSEGCKLDLDYSEVDISNPGTYVYTVNCNDSYVHNLVTAEGHITVYAAELAEPTVILSHPENNSIICVKAPCNTLDTTFEYSTDEPGCPTECIFHIYRGGEEHYRASQTNISPFVYKFTQEGEYNWMIEYVDASGDHTPSEIWRVIVRKSILNTTTYVCEDYEDPNNYTYNNIRDAIDHVESNGNVKVAIGTYDGPVRINKPIKLLGQGRGSIINAADNILCIVSNGVNVQNFTIDGGRYGILVLNSSDCNLCDNYVTRSNYGIYVDGSNSISINRNQFYQNYMGIVVHRSSNFNIIDNLIDMADYGVFGIYMSDTSKIFIDSNCIQNSASDGIYLAENCDGIIITSSNQFVGGNCDIYFTRLNEFDNTTLPCRCHSKTDPISLESNPLCKICSTR